MRPSAAVRIPPFTFSARRSKSVEYRPGGRFVPAAGRHFPDDPRAVPILGGVGPGGNHDTVGAILADGERVPSASCPWRRCHSASRCPLRTMIFAPAGSGLVAVFLKTVPMIRLSLFPASSRSLRLSFRLRHQFRPARYVGQQRRPVSSRSPKYASVAFSRRHRHEGKVPLECPVSLRDSVAGHPAFLDCGLQHVGHGRLCSCSYCHFYQVSAFRQAASVPRRFFLSMATVPDRHQSPILVPYGIGDTHAPGSGREMSPCKVSAHVTLSFRVVRGRHTRYVDGPRPKARPDTPPPAARAGAKLGDGSLDGADVHPGPACQVGLSQFAPARPAWYRGTSTSQTSDFRPR